MEPEVTPESQIVAPGSEEHTALMVEKFQSQSGAPEQPAEPAPERPSWLPEKFATPEEMAASYSELERKQSNTPKEAPAADADAGIEDARAAVAGAGVDFDALSDEYLAGGSLSDASYETLTKAGFDRDLVDSFIEGQQAKADLFRADILLSVGGEETYLEMSEWAARSLTPSELEAYNSQVDSGNLTAAKMAVAGLKARFIAENGAEPELLNSETGGNSNEVFRSTSELTAAMRDPRYKKDPAYRDDVARKIKNSSLF